MEENILRKLLIALQKNEGSDLHLKSGAIPRIRIHGKMKAIKTDVIEKSYMENLLSSILLEEKEKEFYKNKFIDFTYDLDEKSRFRVNFFHQINGLSAVFRIIPIEIPTIEELNLPGIIRDFTHIHRGLILVTGVTGSGKSTTLAALLNEINMRDEKHIITIEDPVEFVHKDKKSLINQIEIGENSNSFGASLKSALREDPDIILVGEMRDLETIETAVHAANTGHLVFSTLHTLDAKETIDRIIGMFPTNEQNRIRTSLASVLEGIISQRLVETKGGGRSAAIEILKKTARIEELIKNGQDAEIPDAIFEGKEIYGSQTFDQAIIDLYDAKRITEDVALKNATNPADMKLRLEGIGAGASKSKKRKSDDSFFDLKNPVC